MARFHTTLLHVFWFVFLESAASLNEHPVCDGSDGIACESARSWAEEDGDQGLEFLQLKGTVKSERSWKCPVPDLDAYASVGKGCAECEAPPGQDEACLGGNHGYMYLEEAWKSCGENFDCGAVYESPTGKFYIRRLHDPEIKCVGGKLFLYDCKEEVKQFKEDAKAKEEEVKQFKEDAKAKDETTLKQTANQINRIAGVQVHKANIQGSIAKELKPGSIEKTNIVFIRVAKTGSTTACGVTRNIAAHHNLTGAFGTRSWPGKAGEPGVWAGHGALNAGEYGPNPSIDGHEDEPVEFPDKYPDWMSAQSLVSPTFLWTMVREPRERARSHYYWLASRRFEAPSEKNKLRYFSMMTGNEIYRYIRPTAAHNVQQVVDTYGLIGLSERYDESLVVLAATLKVPLSEILYLRAKDTSAGFVDPAGIKHNATPHYDEEPQSVRDWLTKDFPQTHKLDYELYDLANKTLDAKIKAMKLEPAIKAFKVLLATAQQECAVPDSDKVAINDLVKCYSSDTGCNYECLSKYDGMARKMCTWC